MARNAQEAQDLQDVRDYFDAAVGTPTPPTWPNGEAHFEQAYGLWRVSIVWHTNHYGRRIYGVSAEDERGRYEVKGSIRTSILMAQEHYREAFERYHKTFF